MDQAIRDCSDSPERFLFAWVDVVPRRKVVPNFALIGTVKEIPEHDSGWLDGIDNGGSRDSRKDHSHPRDGPGTFAEANPLPPEKDKSKGCVGIFG